MVKIYLRIYLALHIVFVNMEKENNFGSFNLTLDKFVSCNGPKHKDCTTSNINISGYNLLKYELIVLKNTVLQKSKVVALKSGVEMLRFQMKKPCDHLFFRPLLQTFMNVTKDCVVLKGRYEFTVDVQKLAQNYWGGSFLFGNWTFKSLFYNDECNFYCSVIDVVLFSNK